jgi:hypothetical protein
VFFAGDFEKAVWKVVVPIAGLPSTSVPLDISELHAILLVKTIAKFIPAIALACCQNC